jgi:hypothetical protein
VLADTATRKPDHVGDGSRHRRHVAGRHQTPSVGSNEFGDTAAGERDDGGAACHRFGDHQPVGLVPHRSDESG